MVHQRLLLFATDRLSAHRWRDGHIELEAEFAGNATGLEAFARYLEQHRDSTFRLLALQAEESFQVEAIPHARGRDRAALLARKLDQHSYGAPLSFALSLGREGVGRRHERFLFAAVTSGQQLEPWFELLAAAKIRLAGLYTVPLLAGNIGAAAAGAAPLFQLLILTAVGMHQTVFEHGQPRLSRLTRLTGGDPQEAAATAAAESAKTYQYLVAQRVLDPGEVLATVVLLHPDHLADFRSRCTDSEGLRYVFADLYAETGRCGLKTLSPDSCSETLLLHSMLRKPPRAQYAPIAMRRCYRLWQLGLALAGLSVAVLIGGGIVAGVQLFEYRRLAAETGQLRALTTSDAQHLAAARGLLPAQPADSGKLHAVVTRYDRLEREDATLEPMYQRISRALASVPGISLERIDWRADAASPEGSPTGVTAAVVAEVVARLPAELANDPRAQLDAIGRFSAALSPDQAVAVSSLALPLETGSSHSLKGGSDPDVGSELNHDAAQFSLRIVAARR